MNAAQVGNMSGTDLDSVRAEALRSWEQHGWPSARLEGWRNTNLRKAREAAGQSHASATWIGSKDSTDGVTIADLNSCFKDPTVARWLGQVAPTNTPQSALSDRNTGLFARGLFVHVARGTTVRDAIVLSPDVVKPGVSEGIERCLIVAEANSDVTIVHRFASESGTPYVRNVVAEVVAMPGARVRYVWLQEEAHDSFHIATLATRLHRDARLEAHTLQLGGALGRFDCQVRMVEPGASCQINGLCNGDGRRHLDCNVDVHHDAGHTDSQMLFKSILDDHSGGVFRGNVLIHAGASKSTSEQVNRNLLLSNNATVNTKPQLEIDNDDVRAAHGATVGELDSEALFYLKSRGINADTARKMMIAGFAAEVLERLPDPAMRDLYSARFAV